MKRTSDIIGLLEACEIVIESSRLLFHYKEITEIIVDSGYFQPYGKEGNFDQIVYCALRSDIKKNGDRSRFRFLGNGIFCSCNIDGVDNIEKPQVKRKIKNDKKKKEEEDKKHIDKKCLNCKFIEFSGINEVTMERGYCNNKNSGRGFISSNEQACEKYCQISFVKINSREKKRIDFEYEIRKENIASKRKR